MRRRRDTVREHCRQDRDWLLEEFLRRFGPDEDSPGPVLPCRVLDDILTDLLGFHLVDAELPGGQLALCDFDRRRVTVNTRMGDDVRPNTDLVALANSTKAHELGHIRLHEQEICLVDRATPDLFGDAPPRVLVTFRDEERKGRLSREELRREWEADLYASVFLVPEGMLEEQREMVRLRRAVVKQEELSSKYLWRLTYELARTFGVSPTLMKNRLVDLGVVVYSVRDRALKVSGQALLEFPG